MILSSRSNPKVKFARALYRSKARRDHGLFIAEGIHLVGEALDSAAVIHSILYAPDILQSDYANQLIDLAAERGVQSYPTTVPVFESIAAKENPQGILAIIQQYRNELRDLNPENFAFGVALASPQDPGNIGTILRTIDAVGADGLILVDGGADPYHPSAVRASMGSIFWYPVVQTFTQDFTAWVDQHNYHIYATSAQGEVPYYTIQQYIKPLVLLMGSERQGLQPDLVSRSETLVYLPMMGHASSLNLSVATGVMLYDILMKSEKSFGSTQSDCTGDNS